MFVRLLASSMRPTEVVGGMTCTNVSTVGRGYGSPSDGSARGAVVDS